MRDTDPDLATGSQVELRRHQRIASINSKSRPSGKVISAPGYEPMGPGFDSRLVPWLANALVVLSSTAEDGEIEVRISVGESVKSSSEERRPQTNGPFFCQPASQRLRLEREIIRDPPRWGTRTKWQAHQVLFVGNEEVGASRQTNVTKVDSIITPHSSRRPLDETVVVKHNIQRRGLAPSRRTEAVHGPRGGDDAKEELICGLHWTTGTLLFTLLFWRDVSLHSETLYYQNRKGSCGQESPPAPIMLPYMPFMSQYWPFILTGVVCYLGARFLYHRSVAQDQTQDNSHKECNGKVEYKTPDQVAEEKDEDNMEYEDSIPDLTSALPQDLEHVPLEFNRLPVEESVRRSEEFFIFMNSRRTVRFFSPDTVPVDVIRNIVRAAGTAPSGAHTEPWTYVVVSDDEMKNKIREIVEEEEHINYTKRMGIKWTTDLKPFKTNWVKDYLTTAPYIILVFKQMYSFKDDGTKRIHYYNEMSVSLASGILLAAIHVSRTSVHYNPPNTFYSSCRMEPTN
uniref:Nitroreductase domain-containing protein n=1 Tax=Timema genevievae TaxID=629358 RepID=A0A7R9PP36_TIMGE|nr:unnamed protein product [Timema genevievae]